jgi:hypothetical protein
MRWRKNFYLSPSASLDDPVTNEKLDEASPSRLALLTTIT